MHYLFRDRTRRLCQLSWRRVDTHKGGQIEQRLSVQALRPRDSTERNSVERSFNKGRKRRRQGGNRFDDVARVT